MARIVSKILLFVFNVVYFASAVAILVIGSMSLAGETVILEMLDLIHDTSLVVGIVDWKALTLPASIYLVTLGSLAVLLSIIGAFGIFKDHKIILIFFGVSKLCIILFNLALIMYNAILPFHGQNLVTSLMKENLEKNFVPIGFHDGSVVMPTVDSSAWHWAKMEFEQACCAVENSTDYETVLSIWNDKWSVGKDNSTAPDTNNTAVDTNSTAADATNTGAPTEWTGWTEDAQVSATCCMQVNQYVVPGTVSEFVNVTGCLASRTSYVNYRGCSDYVMTILLAYRQVYIIVAASFVALEVILIALIARISDGSRSVGSV